MPLRSRFAIYRSWIMYTTKRQGSLLTALLIAVGWALLACNVAAIFMGSSDAAGANPAGRVAGMTFGRFIHLAMLAFGAISLGLVAYLHFKQRYARTTGAAAVIVAVLAFPLVFPATSPASSNAKIADCNATIDDMDEPDYYAEGVVTGILFSDDRPAAVVGSQVLYEGDIKQGVKVVRIFKDRVQFDKNGLVWTQTVRQVPPKHWK